MDETKIELILADVFLEDEWGTDLLREVMQGNLKLERSSWLHIPMWKQPGTVFACTPLIPSLNR